MQDQLQPDVLADDPLEHSDHAGDGFVEIEQARLHHFAPAEQEQLAGEIGGTLRRGMDLLQTFPYG